MPLNGDKLLELSRNNQIKNNIKYTERNNQMRGILRIVAETESKKNNKTKVSIQTRI